MRVLESWLVPREDSTKESAHICYALQLQAQWLAYHTRQWLLAIMTTWTIIHLAEGRMSVQISYFLALDLLV